MTPFCQLRHIAIPLIVLGCSSGYDSATESSAGAAPDVPSMLPNDKAVGGAGGSDAVGAPVAGSAGSPLVVDDPFAPGCESEPKGPINCGSNCSVLSNGGPPQNRVSLVLIGDGFTQADIDAVYAPHSEALAEYMFQNVNDSEPYVRYKNFINFYRIDLPSPESGIDDPDRGIFVDTPLDGSLDCEDLRGGYCNIRFSATYDAIDSAFAGSDVDRADWRLVTLNSERGCGVTHYPQGGALPIYCPYMEDSLDIALHEGGHGWNRLADTYWTRSERYQGSEPSSVNVTTDPSGAKWSQWLGYVDPILGEIAAYEGGHQYEFGVYRPSYNQKMGSAERCHNPGPPYCPHDAVSREKIILDIYDIVRPLDAWAENADVLENPEELWVDVVDCSVIKVDWLVDGELIEPDYGERFSPADLSPGRHRITAHAYDDTEWVRLDRETLQQEVSWDVDIVP